MEFILFFCVGFLLILLIAKRRPKTHLKYFNDGLPSVKWAPFTLPLIDGFITAVKLRKDGVKLLENLTAKYGKSFRFKLLTVELLATSDVKILQKVMTSTTPEHLNKPQEIYKFLFSEFLNGGMIAADFARWEHHRKAVSSAFSYKTFPTYLEFMDEAAKELVKATNGQGNTIENVEMKKFIDRAAVQIITNIIMGSNRSGISSDAQQTFHTAFQRSKTIHLERFLRPELFIPLFWKLHPMSKIFYEDLATVTQITSLIIDKYRAQSAQEDNESGKDINPKCVIELDTTVTEADIECGIKPASCLIEQMIKSEMSNKDINDEVATFLSAGHETSVNAIDMLIFHLARHPEYQKLCHEEIDKLFESHEQNEKFTLEDFSELKYLERVILESMRLTPTVSFYMRKLTADLEIEEDCILKAGTTVVLEPWVTHRDPEYYPDPEKFDPDRFLPENVKLRPYHSYFPFSLGPRICIGWKVSLLEIKVIMTYILRHFEMTTTDRMEDVKMLFELTLKPERNYDITFKRRQIT